MEAIIPFLFAGVVGLSHAFEADHLIAVSNIVTKRNSVISAARDGIFWGLGHSTTILLVGCIIIIGQATFLSGVIEHLEILVGIMLIVLGIYRLNQWNKEVHQEAHHSEKHNHKLAYGVGLIHGLAGSGVLVLAVMGNLQNSWASMLYLGVFGLGSMIGMLLAAGFLSLTIYKKWKFTQKIRQGFIIVSSSLCILYGILVLTSGNSLHSHSHEPGHHHHYSGHSH